MKMTDADQISATNLTELSSNELSDKEKSIFLKAVMKKSLSTVEGMNTVMMATLPPNVRKRVEYLKEIQSIHGGLESAYRVELAALESKYNGLYEPLYTKRYEIVNGIAQVDGTVSDEAAPVNGVPEFWLNAMTSNDILSCVINEEDMEVLKFLKDIKSGNPENAKGFTLEFYFDTNPFFSNSILTKTYLMMDDEDENILEKSTGTVIDWYPGKNLLEKAVEKEGSGDEETSDDDEEESSFFKFFSPPEVPNNIKDLNDRKTAELQDILERDLEIGFTIKEKIIPKAVSWFTGEAIKDDLFLDLGNSDTDDDEDENGQAENGQAENGTDAANGRGV